MGNAKTVHKKEMKVFLISVSVILLFILGSLRNKRAKNKVVHVINSSCTGCQCCLKKCRHKALDMANDEMGLRVAVKYPKKCTACGDCVAVCKFNALELVNRE